MSERTLYNAQCKVVRQSASVRDYETLPEF